MSRKPTIYVKMWMYCQAGPKLYWSILGTKKPQSTQFPQLRNLWFDLRKGMWLALYIVLCIADDCYNESIITARKITSNPNAFALSISTGYLRAANSSFKLKKTDEC